jgi:hypothetical protein
MIRGPKSGNGTQSSAYYLDSADPVSRRPRPRAPRRAPGSEMDPLVAGIQADGSLAACPKIGASWPGAGLAQREQALAAFVPASVSAADPSLGWNGIGQADLQSLQVAGIMVRDPQHAVVTLLALLSGQLMELGVPVTATDGGLVVSAEPAWLPAPPRISPRPVSSGSDQVAQSQLMNELPTFFRAYASGDSAALNSFTVHGASVTGLGGAVTFDQISALHVPPGGTTRQITVTVIWQLWQAPGSAATGNPGVTSNLEMTYGMSVVDLHGGKWYVKEIGASSEVGAR